MDDILFAPQGWQCPICKRVYSPTTPMCWYCSPQQTTVTTTGTGVTQQKPTGREDLLGMFNDDITFCPDDRCPNLECVRNPKNIVFKSLPHSYYIEIPQNCPLKKHQKGGDEGEV